MTHWKTSETQLPRNLYFVGRNYAKHIEELQNERPERPLIFMKPLSCLSIEAGISYPQHTNNLHFEGEMVFVLPGGTVALRKQETVLVGCGLDWTARDVQNEIKQKGWPWFEAKCFAGSAVVSRQMVEVPLSRLGDLSIETWVNGELRQSGSYKDKLFPLVELVAFLESRVPLERGDLLFTGTPEGVAAVDRGASLTVRLMMEDRVLIDCKCEVENGDS